MTYSRPVKAFHPSDWFIDTYMSLKRPMRFNPRLNKQLVKKAFLPRMLQLQETVTSGCHYYHMGTIYRRMMLPWGQGWGRGMKARKDYIFWHYYFSRSRFRMRLILPVHLCYVLLLSCRPTISSGLPVSSFPGNSLWAPHTIFGLRRTGSPLVFVTKNF